MIQRGYTEWIAEPPRGRSPELDFGVWWRVSGSRYTWRVSWIEATGELYAKELASGDEDRFVVLGTFSTEEEAEAAMEGWAAGDHDLARFFPELRAGGGRWLPN